ncbi:MAG: pilus assembly protein N-terminal domain-containing protein [Hyphomicrobiales bacterium]|nr:pilus assembly protein N-terminal domain-containing protein [Hyphomicrobiales bacterium]MBV9112665.1 pilus assembly protein N-terminal domain-containing protein [Hyphomicrobiales bacterium]
MMKQHEWRCALAILIGTVLVTSLGAVEADELAPITVVPQPTQVVSLTQGYSNTIHVSRPFSTIHITDPDVVDIVLTTDRTATLVPKAAGATNVDIFDDKNRLISGINVIVNADEKPGQVRIFDHKSLTGHTSYHCGINTCRYFEETIAKQQPQVTETRSVERIIHEDHPTGQQQ